MAKQQQKTAITGFHLGGFVPLSGVGYIMAAIYERGGEMESTAPLYTAIKESVEPMPQVAPSNSIAGLLPAPATIGEGTKEDTRRAVVRSILTGAPPYSLKRQDIARQTKDSGISDFILKGVIGRMTQAGQITQNADGYLAIAGVNVSGGKQDSAKLALVLAYLATKDKNGADRKEIMAQFTANGYAGSWDQKVMLPAMADGRIVKAGYGRYALASISASPPPASDAATPSRRMDTKKAISQVLQENGATTLFETVKASVRLSGATDGAIRQAIKTMIKTKAIVRKGDVLSLKKAV